MQLKGFLLIGFVLNVVCLKNLSGKFLSPKYDILNTDLLSLHKNESLVESIKKDPSSFIKLFTKVDPGKINQVIGILELLLTDASSALDILESHVTDATNNLNTANSNLVIAQHNLESANVFLEHSNAVIDQTNAAVQKDDADQNYNEEGPNLINEQEVIREVIGMLRSLIDDNNNNDDTPKCVATCKWYYPKSLEVSREDVCYKNRNCYQLAENGGMYGTCDGLEKQRCKQISGNPSPTAPPTAPPTASATREFYSKLRLTFTKVHGATAICVGGFALKDASGVEIDWSSLNPTITDTGEWSSSWDSPNILKNRDGYYCSEHGSFKNDVLTGEPEIVLFELETPVNFASFELQQDDGMGYNPQDWKLEGFASSASWVKLFEITGFNFDASNEIKTFEINDSQEM